MKKYHFAGSLYIAPSFGLDFHIGGSIVGIAISADISSGVEITAGLYGAYILEDGSRYHASKKCFHGQIGRKAGFGVNLTISFVTHSIFGPYTIEWPSHLPFYFAKDPFTDSGMSKECPHYGYYTEINVYDTDDNPLTGVAISYVPDHDAYNLDGICRNNTGGSFRAPLYIPMAVDSSGVTSAQTVTVTAEYTPRDSTKPLTGTVDVLEQGATQNAVNLYIDCTRYCVVFRSISADEPANMPNNIVFYKQLGLTVTIPENIPTLSGRKFCGWSLDGSNVQYIPGDTITVSDQNTKLYAIWELESGNDHMVYYHSNGGADAPVVKFYRDGESFQLLGTNGAYPSNAAGEFLGWSCDPYASEPDEQYTPGETLTAGTDFSGNLYLYAVWSVAPVIPARVTYDANGSDGTPPPASYLIREASWIMIDSIRMIWDDQHIFQGWSTNPNAAKAQLKGGDSFFVTEDTTFYAVWKTDYKITEGQGAVWTLGTEGTLRFKANGDIFYFRDIVVDGKTVPRSAYDLSSGSTIVELSSDWLNKLAKGTHTLTFVYADGRTPAVSFTVHVVPKTGDSSQPALLCILIGASILALCLIVRRKRA